MKEITQDIQRAFYDSGWHNSETAIAYRLPETAGERAARLGRQIRTKAVPPLSALAIGIAGCASPTETEIQKPTPIVEKQPTGMPSEGKLCKEEERPALKGVVRGADDQPLIGVKVTAVRKEKQGCPPESNGTSPTLRTTEDGQPNEPEITCKTVWVTEEAKWTHKSPEGEWNEDKLYPVFPAGYYQVPGFSAGSHKVTFEAEGYQPQTIEIDFSCGEQQVLDIVLSPR